MLTKLGNHANIFRFLNERRLRNYPRLMLVVVIMVLACNVFLREGWVGAVGQIIGCDFIMLYSAGVLYRQDPVNLYNFELQGQIQQRLLAPTGFEGILPFNYPPYVAAAIQFLTFLELPYALILWTLFTLLFTISAVRLMKDWLLPQKLKDAGLDAKQLGVITLSFFPFVEGLQVGQNHGLTLLLLTVILVFSLQGKSFWAGVAAGLTIYKPQFALGFLILWFVWKDMRALIGFSLIALLWAGITLIHQGPNLFQNYVQLLPLLLKMVYLKGFGGYLELTPYGLLIKLFPPRAWQSVVWFSQLLTVGLATILAVFAFQHRDLQGAKISPEDARKFAYILAGLFPLLAAPHTLLHDLIIVVPLFLLWADLWPTKGLLLLCVGIYLAAFLLPIICYLTEIPFLALMPLLLVAILLRQMFSLSRNN